MTIITKSCAVLVGIMLFSGYAFAASATKESTEAGIEESSDIGSHISLEKHSEKSIGDIRVEKMCNSVTMINFFGYGTNIGLVTNEQYTLLIDPVPGHQKFNLLTNIIKSVSDKPVKYIINTHRHPDHSGGNQYFTDLGARVLNFNQSTAETDAILAQFNLTVTPVNSHTERDLLIFHQGCNIVFTGDVFDNSWHPTFYSGGLDGLSQSVAVINQRSNKLTQIVPGHGPLANLAVLNSFKENTVYWVKQVLIQQKKGLNVEQIAQQQAIQDAAKRFDTQGRERFISREQLERFISRTIEYVLPKLSK